MYQAIQVKYLGPTNTLGARYKATAAAGSVVVPIRYELNPEENHTLAAKTLCARFDWEFPIQGGVLADGSYVFVRKSDE